MRILNAFLDANIFVAGTKSPSGGSRLILELARARKIKIFTVQHALLEAERNIIKKFGENYLPIYHKLLIQSEPVIQPISRATLREVEFLAGFVPRKDVPILLGALSSGCGFLVTLDRKDFLSNTKLLGLSLPFRIVSPGNFLEEYLHESGN